MVVTMMTTTTIRNVITCLNGHPHEGSIVLEYFYIGVYCWPT